MTLNTKLKLMQLAFAGITILAIFVGIGGASVQSDAAIGTGWVLFAVGVLGLVSVRVTRWLRQ